jgi:hypothetical protein
MPDKRDIAASPAGFAPPARIVQAVEQTAREPWLEGCSRFVFATMLSPPS